MPPALLLCSNSTWMPAIRRDHAMALEASARGYSVAFLERPRDIRALRSERGRWLRGLARPGERRLLSERLELRPRSTLVPGHRGGLAERLDSRLLARSLGAGGLQPGVTVVATTPWQWPAVAAAEGARRVFDAADDWRRLNPKRAARFQELYTRVAREADEIVVVSEALRELFPGRDVKVIRNAVGDELLSPAPTSPGSRRLVYAGTLSERFDAELLAGVLPGLPDWHLDLYGECQYAGQGDDPGAELQGLLDSFDGRVRWHGVVPRERLAAVLDEASVLVIPNRTSFATGQDSMKAYDYAARGRPIITTSWPSGLDEVGPPHLYRADGAEEFRQRVLEAAAEPAERSAERREWAAGQTWVARWPEWSKALFGG